MSQEETVKALFNLGLTVLQAKVYIALAKLGTSTARTTAKVAQVASQDVYRILGELQEKGLVEKIITKPTIYKATPIKEGYYLLLQNKTREYTELQKQTINLIKKSPESNDKTTFQEEEQQFILISSKNLVMKKWEKEDALIQNSLDVIGYTASLYGWITDHLQTFNAAIERGVKIRIITTRRRGGRPIDNISPVFRNNSLFEVRYVASPLTIICQIYDRKKVSMYAGAPNGLEGISSLFSNNPQFVKVISAYFEELWNKALDESGTLTSKNVKLKQPSQANY